MSFLHIWRARPTSIGSWRYIIAFRYTLKGTLCTKHGHDSFAAWHLELALNIGPSALRPRFVKFHSSMGRLGERWNRLRSSERHQGEEPRSERNIQGRLSRVARGHDQRNTRDARSGRSVRREDGFCGRRDKNSLLNDGVNPKSCLRPCWVLSQ